jgi:hypothetical protein
VAPKVSGYLRDVQVSDNQSVKAGQLLATIDDRYIFYMNPVPGIAMVATLWLTLEREPMRLELLRHGDWLGILTMALGLTALQTVPDEGNKDDCGSIAFHRAPFPWSASGRWHAAISDSARSHAARGGERRRGALIGLDLDGSEFPPLRPGFGGIRSGCARRPCERRP